MILKELLPLQAGDFKDQFKTLTMLALAYKQTGNEDAANKVYILFLIINLYLLYNSY